MLNGGFGCIYEYMNAYNPEHAWTKIRPLFNLTHLSEGLGLTRSAVAQWRRVPEQHVYKLATLTGVSVARLRPDLFKVDPWANLTV